jgi:hypothetical protein
MRTGSFFAIFVLVTSPLAGCGDDGGVTDTGVGFDSSVDTGGGDASPDTGTVDSSADAAVDAAPDATADSSMSMDSTVAMDSSMIFACTLEELTPIFECARSSCLSLPDASLPDVSISADGGIPDVGLPDASLPDPGELATCILVSCGALVFGVSSDCRGCLLAGVGMDLDEIRMMCAPGISTP